MLILFKCLVLLFIFHKYSQINAERLYINCDLWDESENGINLTDLIFSNVLQEIDNITEIFVEYGKCGIKNIGESAFEEHENIVYLSLERNGIEEIKEYTFINNEMLRILKLNNNNLTKLDDDIFLGLENLQYLYLQENKIRYINFEIFNDLFSLSNLHLENNQIAVLEISSFIDNTQLVYLNLQNNPLKDWSIGNRSLFKNDIRILINSDVISKNLHELEPASYTTNNMFDTDFIIITCLVIIFATILIIAVVVIMKCKRREKIVIKNEKFVKKEDLLYDQVKIPSEKFSDSGSYVEANISDDKDLNKRFFARRLSSGYLEPRTVKQAFTNYSHDSYLSIH